MANINIKNGHRSMGLLHQQLWLEISFLSISVWLTFLTVQFSAPKWSGLPWSFYQMLPTLVFLSGLVSSGNYCHLKGSCFLVMVSMMLPLRVGTVPILLTIVFSRPAPVSYTWYMFHNISSGRVAVIYCIAPMSVCSISVNKTLYSCKDFRMSKRGDCILLVLST